MVFNIHKLSSTILFYLIFIIKTNFSKPITESVNSKNNIKDDSINSINYQLSNNKQIPNKNILNINNFNVLNSKRNLLKDDKVIDLYLLNNGNAIYELDSYLGSSSQSLKLLINTGEEYSWLINRTCTNCTVSYSYYDKSLSNTYKSLDKRVDIPFSKGIKFNLNGVLSQDGIRFIGMTAPFTYQFALIDNMNGTINIPLDGSIGLSPIKSTSTENNLMYYLKKNNITKNQNFGIFTGSQEQNSILTLGGYNKDIVKNTSNIFYCDSEKDSSSWNCPSTNIKFSNSTHNNTINIARKIIFDSVTNLITMPKSDFLLLKDYIFRDSNDCEYFSDNVFHCVCNSVDFTTNTAFPKISFELNGGNTVVSLDSDDYVYLDTQMVLPDSTCLIAIRLSYSNSDEWVLGNNFLRNYYTIYNNDNNTIGFYDIRQGGYGSYGMIVIVTAAVVAAAIFLFSTLYCIYKRCMRTNNRQENLL